MIHGVKGDVFRITSKTEFDEAQPCIVVWTPEIPQQGCLDDQTDGIIDRSAVASYSAEL